jgi:hypothetical protein
MRLVALTTALLVMLGLAACGGLRSQTATVYEFDEKQWLVTSFNSVGQGEGLFSQTTSRSVALRQPDGSFRQVAASRFSDDEAEEGAVVEINPTIRRNYVRNSDDPVGDLIGEIVREGVAVAEVNPSGITYARGVYRFPESAKRTPSTAAAMGSDY